MDDIKIKVIDSNKLVNAINEGSYDVNLSAVMALGAVMLDTKNHNRDDIPEIIERHLAIEPEIIRCKDCEHLQKWRSEESAKKFGQMYECARHVLNCPKPEDFCSRAERKVITGHKYHDPFGNPIYVYVRVGNKTVAIKADDLQKALDYVTKHGEEYTIEGRSDTNEND